MTLTLLWCQKTVTGTFLASVERRDQATCIKTIGIGGFTTIFLEGMFTSPLFGRRVKKIAQVDGLKILRAVERVALLNFLFGMHPY